jgi:hypothetical protein
LYGACVFGKQRGLAKLDIFCCLQDTADSLPCTSSIFKVDQRHYRHELQYPAPKNARLIILTSSQKPSIVGWLSKKLHIRGARIFNLFSVLRVREKIKNLQQRRR